MNFVYLAILISLVVHTAAGVPIFLSEETPILGLAVSCIDSCP